MQGFGAMGRVVAMLLLAALCAGPAQAQTATVPDNGGILTINPERLFAGSLYGERIAAEVEAESEALAAENRRIEAALTEEERSLTEQRSQMEPEAFRALADAFDEKVQGIRRAQDNKTRALSRRLDEERQAFFNLALPVLADLLRERGAVAILDRRVVFASSDSIDVTDEALRRIDATLGDGKQRAAPPQDEAPPETPQD